MRFVVLTRSAQLLTTQSVMQRSTALSAVADAMQTRLVHLLSQQEVPIAYTCMHVHINLLGVDAHAERQHTLGTGSSCGT